MATERGPLSTRARIRRALTWLIALAARLVALAALPLVIWQGVEGHLLAAIAIAGGGIASLAVVRLTERFWSKWRAGRALVPAPMWVVVPAIGSLLGTLRLSAQLAVRVGLLIALPVGTVEAIGSKKLWAIGVAALVWFGVLLWLSFAAVRNRVIVGEFDYVSVGEEKAPPAKVDVADLLRGDLARLANLLQVVGDRRAVASGLSEQTALDATLSVDELSDAFSGAAGDELKLSWGKASIPLAPFVRLLGKLVASPRISGRLHEDGSTLILTAQTTGARRISWRVDASRDGLSSAPRRPPIVGDLLTGQRVDATDRTADAARDDSSNGADIGEALAPSPVVTEMVRELAFRIYTDLALDQSVRWEACEHFVAGLRSFRSCLRTPKDRKFNLRRAEGEFLEALAEDEDFPLAFYNLGVVYTELFGLALAAGRNQEARMRRSAAETSFGRAIEKAPRRWDCHFAFAQTQLSYGRRDTVVDLGDFMLRRARLTFEQEAKTRELMARASVLPVISLSDETRRDRGRNVRRGVGGSQGTANPPAGAPVTQAWREARRAGEQSLRALCLARARRETLRSRYDDDAGRAAQLASACLLTYGKCHLQRELSRHRPPETKRIRQRCRWRMRALIGVLSRLGDARAEFQHDYGVSALDVGDLTTAEKQLREAAASAPTRPDYAADLAKCRVHALKRAKQGAGTTTVTNSERDDVLSPALKALRGMARAFSPAHDLDACESVADVYTKLALTWDHEHVKTAIALKKLRDRVKIALDAGTGSAPTSAVFLQNLRPNDEKLLGPLIGSYGNSARQAYQHLVHGRELKDRETAGDDGWQALMPRAAVRPFELALQCAERAVSLNPLSTFAWETQGDIFAEFSDYENARDAWKQALRTDPDNPTLYGKIGQSHWNIAFQGSARHEVTELECAARYFRAALLLYSRDDRDTSTLTHYRLSKLYSALGKLADARLHLRIVAAAAPAPPIVGWLNFALACLRAEEFSEAEYYLRLVVKHGRELAVKKHVGPATIIGHRLDERLWPLALVRAWGHVGLVLSWADRDARAKNAEAELERAEEVLKELYPTSLGDPAEHERFPTRIAATIAEARGRQSLIDEHPEEAIRQLEEAVSQYPYSRTYAALADALDRKASARSSSDVLMDRAARLAEYAATLGPAEGLPAETRKLLERFELSTVVAGQSAQKSIGGSANGHASPNGDG
jgi:tetratricopeptide (TPR) repeat protein